MRDDLRDFPTISGWRRTYRSGEGKMIARYGREFAPSGTEVFLHFFAFRNFPENLPVKK
jgi:hypothetical protein